MSLHWNCRVVEMLGEMLDKILDAIDRGLKLENFGRYPLNSFIGVENNSIVECRRDNK